MIISRGKNTPAAMMLKRSWTVAPEKALLNSFLRDICVSETMVAVTDVPIFAPIIIGIAR